MTETITKPAKPEAAKVAALRPAAIDIDIDQVAAYLSSTSHPALTYRVSAVCEKLGVSRATIYRMVSAGKLKLVKISKRSSGITAESLHRHIGV